MKRNIIRLTESDLHNIIRHCIMEEYGKWFQSEENGAIEVNNLMRQIKPLLSNLDSLSPNEVWEVVRKLAYINHSAFKVRPGMWDKYPDETLDDKDFRLNNVIYSFKERALAKLIDWYERNGYDVAADEKRAIVAFREPTKGIRQITFHVGRGSQLVNRLERDDATWDGVKQAHHYADDESYQKERYR